MLAHQLPIGRPHTFRFSDGERSVFERRERLPPSQWAEKHIVVPDAAENKGPYRNRKSPHTAWLMDTWAEPWVVHLIVCLPPQTSKTMSMVVTKFWAVINDPGPIMTVYADEGTIKKMSGEYVTEIIDASPTLRKVKSSNPDDTAHKLIRFRNGARWYFSNANNPKDLASVPIRYADADERAKWPKFSGSEVATRDASPWRLLFMRTRSYKYTKKLFSVSSVRVEDDDIWTALRDDAQQLYARVMPCPACGAEQRMVWGRFRIADGRAFHDVTHTEVADRDLGRYACAKCGALWDDVDRDAAARAGRWVAVDRKYVLDPDFWDEPFPEPPEAVLDRPAVPGAHAAAWVSPFVSLSEVIAEFLRAHREPDPVMRKALLMAWTNNYPSKPWREEKRAALATDAVLRLRDERPEGVVPTGALLLLLTADVQGDGVWYELRAWDEHRTSWLVKKGFLVRSLGAVIDPDAPEAEFLMNPDFRALQSVAEAEYPTADGELYPVWFGLVDARYRTNEVYRFCAEVCRRLSPAMGYETRMTPIGYRTLDVYPGTHKAVPNATRRVDTHTNFWKDELLVRLGVDPGAIGSWNLNAAADAQYAQHYTSESKDPQTGLWSQRGRQPNHLWDCGVLQLVAFKTLEDQQTIKALVDARHPAPPPPRATPAGAAVQRERLW